MKTSSWQSILLLSFGLPFFGAPLVFVFEVMSVPPPPGNNSFWPSPIWMSVLAGMMLLGAAMIGLGIYFASLVSSAFSYGVFSK